MIDAGRIKKGDLVLDAGCGVGGTAIVYGIESICYASPKLIFLKEAYRMLKPGGRLVISDGYLKRNPVNQEEKQLIEEFKQAFCLKELITAEAMESQIRLAGFKLIKSLSKTEAVKPAVDGYYQFLKRMSLIIKLIDWVPGPFFYAIRRNNTALIKAKEGIDKELFIGCRQERSV